MGVLKVQSHTRARYLNRVKFFLFNKGKVEEKCQLDFIK